MVAHRTVQETGSVIDKAVQQIVGNVGGIYVGDAASYEEIVLRTGSEPSHAIIGIPITPGVDDEMAGSIFDTEIDQYIRHGERGRVDIVAASGIDGLGFAGSVCDVYRDIGNGSIAVRMIDDRRFMRNVKIVGAHVWNVIGSAYAYINSMPAHFNPGGRPNCIFGPDGEPYFSPWPDFGLDSDEAPPEPTDGHTSKACNWTIGNIFRYLRKHHGPGATRPAKYAYLSTCPDTIVWPDTISASLDADAVANFDQGVEQPQQFRGSGRKGREFYAEGYDLNSVISLLLETAGGWTWWLAPQVTEADDGSSTIENIFELVPSRYPGGGDTLFYQRQSDSSDEMRALITKGGWGENSEDFRSTAIVAGETIFAENRVDSRTVADGGTYTLIPAWTTARYDAFRQRVLEDQELDDAFKLFPEVLTTWKLASDYEFHNGIGCALAGWPRAALPRQLLTKLLSYMGPDNGPTDYATMRFPISFEFLGASGSWASADEFNGLRVLDDGRIYVPGLRINGKSWRWTSTDFADDGSGKANMTVQPIRFSCAIPTDHRLISVAELSGNTVLQDVDDDQDMLLYETVEDMPDADRITPYLKLVHYVDAADLYKCWLRSTSTNAANNSWPRPESLNPAEGSPNARVSLISALRSDADMQQAHARKALYDGGRLKGRGELIYEGWLVGSMRPGLSVANLVSSDGTTTMPVRKVITEVRFKGQYEAVETGIKLG
ncbi:MAG: hypothetical protein L6R28_06630 [Planctomycetes bacterium]|nr:hypothetical protein [Planctomycetota bacterium]